MNRQNLTRTLFRWLGKDPDAVIVSFCPGPAEPCEAMLAEVRELLPDRRHFVVRLQSEGPIHAAGMMVVTIDDQQLYRQLRQTFRPYRVGLAPTLWKAGHPLCRAALRLAPLKVLAYNGQLERHHLHWKSPIASLLFLRGVPLDRIFLRPTWAAPWKRDRSVWPREFRPLPARGPRQGFRRVAVLTPYSPYPLSHGGAVRMFALLREAASEFDIYLFWFSEGADPGPLRELCAGLYAADLPRYREPRWSSVDPPETREFWYPDLERHFQECCRREGVDLIQVEYTQLARYTGQILVEHDVTFDLFRQIYEREPTRSRWWDWWRWQRFELRAVRRFPQVVVMSDKDAALLPGARTVVIPNGVDLDRFRPMPDADAPELLFVGSFRHFPNIAAYRFFTEEVWPIVKQATPGVTLTVVAGPDPLLYWSGHVGTKAPDRDEQVRLLGFTADVRPLYQQAQVVLVPTTISAGTNLKVLEALAMERAVVSTSSGCAGLGVTGGQELLVADEPARFAEAVTYLLADAGERRGLARRGRQYVEQHFGWQGLGEKQRQLWTELLK